MMPYYDNERFHGREKLLNDIGAVLDPAAGSAFADDTEGLRSFAISGRGGMGKSQLAAKYVHRNKSVFDAIFWVHADTRSKLRRSFSRIAVNLGLVEEESTEAQDDVLTRDIVLGWLTRPLRSYKQRESEQVKEASWCVIFDNADEPALLEDYWPRDSTGAVLVTSKVPLQALRLFTAGPGIVMPPFDPEETAAFLLDITDRKNSAEDRAQVKNVARRLGNMPLAVAQMAGTIVRSNLTFAEFLEQYENPEMRDFFFRQPVGNKGDRREEQNFLSVWGFDKLKPGASGLLDVLAFLDPDGIPENILQDNSVGVEMTGFPQSQPTYLEARTELLHSSLIDRDRDNKSIVIHRLTQETVRANLSPQRYSEVFVSALQLLSGVWPYEAEFGFIKDETFRWRECNELYKHVTCVEKLSPGLSPPTVFSTAHLQPPKLVLDAAW